jgi:putative redox protein
VAHLFEGSLDEIEARGSAEVVLAGRRFTVTRDFVQDLTKQRMLDAIWDLGRPC